ncbi:Fic family protein [Candidatus Pacearchaeota archaeon]|nr:Fic family protein [Candidatus Pacearchaeota archaeon]
MVYHEVREIEGKKQNYLVHNIRANGKWSKKSKFMGYGNLSKTELQTKREEFELELAVESLSVYLTKEQKIEIEKLKKVYNEKTKSLTREEFEKFENTFFTELTYNSNAIEGSSLSLEDTNLIVNEGLVPEGKTLREIHEARNHMQAIRFLKGHKKDIDERFILKLHAIILKDISERFAGRYRENKVRIFGSDVSFPDAKKVPQLMGNLVYWYEQNKKKLHPFELAIIFSVKFVSIHPFVDGNGRMSRLLMNYLLQRNKYPWINIYNKHRGSYLRTVRKANDEDYLSIIDFCIKTLKENLESFKIV